MKLIYATGNNVRNAVSAAKKLIGRPELRIKTSNKDDDTLNWRVELTDGTVIEVLTRHHGLSTAVLAATAVK